LRGGSRLAYFARCYISTMEIAEIRLNNLIALMKSRGQTQADFAREMHAAPAYISQIINRHGGRRMGSAFARRVEIAYGLERGWMDHDHSVVSPTHNGSKHQGLSEAAIMVGKTWDELDEATQAHVRALINKLRSPRSRTSKNAGLVASDVRSRADPRSHRTRAELPGPRRLAVATPRLANYEAVPPVE
jgi:transcriptional regulator with XRE-family HTH domain